MKYYVYANLSTKDNNQSSILKEFNTIEEAESYKNELNHLITTYKNFNELAKAIASKNYKPKNWKQNSTHNKIAQAYTWIDENYPELFTIETEETRSIVNELKIIKGKSI